MARPASPDPKSEFIPLRVTVGEAADIDNYASAWGMNRSEFLRECARRVIANDRAKARRLRGRG